MPDEPGSEAPSPAGLSGESTPDLKPASQQNEASPSSIEVPRLLANKPGPQVQISRSEASPSILARDTAKSKSRVHAKRAHIKRVLVTFIEKKTKQLQRWSVDAVFSQTARKTSILAFRKGTGVRFYFGPEVSDGDAKQCVGSWFGSLHVHDPESFVNASGSPFSVDLVDEA